MYTELQQVVGKYQGSNCPFLQHAKQWQFDPTDRKDAQGLWNQTGFQWESEGTKNSWFLEFAKSSVICEHRVVLLKIVLVSLICELNLLNQ